MKIDHARPSFLLDTVMYDTCVIILFFATDIAYLFVIFLHNKVAIIPVLLEARRVPKVPLDKVVQAGQADPMDQMELMVKTDQVVPVVITQEVDKVYIACLFTYKVDNYIQHPIICPTILHC